jgi:hypothetical protein
MIGRLWSMNDATVCISNVVPKAIAQIGIVRQPFVRELAVLGVRGCR